MRLLVSLRTECRSGADSSIFSLSRIPKVKIFKHVFLWPVHCEIVLVQEEYT